jgi:hypothetical protein
MAADYKLETPMYFNILGLGLLAMLVLIHFLASSEIVGPRSFTEPEFAIAGFLFAIFMMLTSIGQELQAIRKVLETRKGE